MVLSEKIVLGIEAATPARGVALLKGDRILAQTAPAPPIDARHPAAPSNTILQDIDAVLRAANIALCDVDLFAVTRGPGSFMGLRAGLATVKAFAVTLGKAAIGLPTLEVAARAALFEMKRCDAPLVAYTPAGRGELFAQIFRYDEENRSLSELTAVAHLAPARLVALVENFDEAVWIGCGENARLSELIAEHEKNRAEKKWRRYGIKSLAAHVARVALKKYEEQTAHGDETDRFERAANLHALYVRPSDAELKFNLQPNRSSIK